MQVFINGQPHALAFDGSGFVLPAEVKNGDVVTITAVMHGNDKKTFTLEPAAQQKRPAAHHHLIPQAPRSAGRARRR